MNWFATTFSSSIGRKVLVGVTGLGLVGFLVAHMFGNLNIYCGTDALNSYAEHLHNLPGFGLIELGLLLLFVVHIVLVIGLTRANRAARAGRYAVTASKREDGGSLSAKASKAMVVSGLVMLAFLVLHIWDFRMQRGALHPHGGPVIVAESMILEFQAWWRVAIYTLGSIFVCWHVMHGVQSGFRSVGLNHPKYTPFITKAGHVLAIVIGLGFASVPIVALTGAFDVPAEMADEGADHDDEAPAPDGEPADHHD